MTAVLERLFAHGRDSCCSSSGKTNLMNSRDTLEKFTKNWLSWEGPHSTAEEILLSLSEQMISSEKLTKTPTPCLPELSMGGGRGRGKKGVLKAYFTSHYSFLC